jgi:hypothetical protein
MLHASAGFCRFRVSVKYCNMFGDIDGVWIGNWIYLTLETRNCN